MTFWDVLACLRRHPLITMLGLLLTLGGVYRASGEHGVWASTTTVTLVPPRFSGVLNPLQGQPRSLIDMAGVVADAVSGPEVRPRFSSQNVPLSGTGVLKGFSLHQQDAGAQWNQAFQRPEIVVQVTAPSRAEVRDEMGRLLIAIDTELEQLQTELDVTPENSIVARRDSDSPRVSHERSSDTRSMVVAGVLGVCLTLLAASAADRIAHRRGSHDAYTTPDGPDSGAGHRGRSGTES